MVLGNDEKSGEGADKMDQIEKLYNGYLPVAMREVCIDNLRVFYIGSSVHNSCIKYYVPKQPRAIKMYTSIATM